jgi:regulator of cell morphogenesis and NO signaling
MEITPTTTVGEIAARYPATIRVFQRHGIDFCCGGKQPLLAACTRKDMPFPELKLELEGAGEPRSGAQRNWTDASLEGLVGHIVDHYHDDLRSELPRLEALGRKVLAAHAAGHPEVEPLVSTLLALKAEMEDHMAKEEQVLFPQLLRLRAAAASGEALPLGGPPLGAILATMTEEHEAAGGALARMRALTSGFTPPFDACNSFRGLYHGLAQLESELQEHVHLENNVLFPRALELERRLAL